jgi:integrase/recombinase XerD
MSSVYFPRGPALVTTAPDADSVTLLVLGWLAAKPSASTRVAYARDIGLTPQQRPSHASSWLAWCREQGVHPVTGVTGLHVAWYAQQLDARLAPATVARKLAAISSWYAWLARRRHITTSPAAGLTRPRRSPHTPTPALTSHQARALVHAADTAPGPQRARTAALTTVLLLTGARLNDILAADVTDLDTSHGHRVLWITRPDGNRHSLPLPRPAASRIDAYLATRPPGIPALFATRTGRRLFPADVRRAIRRLAARTGLPPSQARQLGPRTLRRSFAVLYIEAAGPTDSPIRDRASVTTASRTAAGYSTDSSSSSDPLHTSLT